MSRSIIAILRGIRIGEALEIGRALVEAGITRVEVPQLGQSSGQWNL